MNTSLNGQSNTSRITQAKQDPARQECGIYLPIASFGAWDWHAEFFDYNVNIIILDQSKDTTKKMRICYITYYVVLKEIFFSPENVVIVKKVEVVTRIKKQEVVN